MSHSKYAHYYKGIKVEHSEFILHSKNGVIQVANGDFTKVNIPVIKVDLTEKQALEKALNSVKAKQYKWESPILENLLKKMTNNNYSTYFPKGELVIKKDYFHKGDFKIAWKFTISSLEPNNEEWVYVDVNTGIIINRIPLVADVNIPCSAETVYSGNRAITGDTYPGGIRLREVRNNVNVSTLNLQNTFSYGSAVDFQNNNTNWSMFLWPAFFQDASALDVHWGSEMVLDYWRTIFNRNSIDGNGMPVLNYVHAGSNWNNGQWVGGNSNFVQFGDGDGINRRSYSALDILAHEMGHGLAAFTAHLTPGNQESGALNEGFSDIWGACIEHWAAPNKQNWLAGEEIVLGGSTCIRNLQNPKDPLAAEGQHPNTYSGEFWSNTGEPHTNSSILSHWFFLICQGGAGTNDLGNSFNVNAIGIDHGQQIAYRTETVYLTSSSNYSAARTLSIQAARDLYGAGSCEEIAVTNAWFAVGIGNRYIDNITISSTGPDLLCNGSKQYTLSNLSGLSNVNWMATPTGIVTPNSGVGNTFRVYKNGAANGIVNIVANYTKCGAAPFQISKQLSVGTPQPGPITTILADYHMGKIQTQVAPVPGATGYQWYKNGSMIFVGANHTPFTQTNLLQFPIPKQCGMEYDISVAASNICGISPQSHTNVPIPCDDMFVISPNPARSRITVSVDPQTLQYNDQMYFDDVKIFDFKGNLKKHQRFDRSRSATIDVSELIGGIYIVEIGSGKMKEKKQLLVE